MSDSKHGGRKKPKAEAPIRVKNNMTETPNPAGAIDLIGRILRAVENEERDRLKKTNPDIPIESCQGCGWPIQGATHCEKCRAYLDSLK